LFASRRCLHRRQREYGTPDSPPGIVSVALLLRDDEVMIVPLTGQSAGGLLLNQRNARGDRVILAQECFRNRDFPEEFEMRTVPVYWRQDSAALIVRGLKRLA
jgi:hypothetical protein